jgi:hypothetical protein
VLNNAVLNTALDAVSLSGNSKKKNVIFQRNKREMDHLGIESLKTFLLLPEMVLRNCCHPLRPQSRAERKSTLTEADLEEPLRRVAAVSPELKQQECEAKSSLPSNTSVPHYFLMDWCIFN